jgi:hypothetical protein
MPFAAVAALSPLLNFILKLPFVDRSHRLLAAEARGRYRALNGT